MSSTFPSQELGWTYLHNTVHDFSSKSIPLSDLSDNTQFPIISRRSISKMLKKHANRGPDGDKRPIKALRNNERSQKYNKDSNDFTISNAKWVQLSKNESEARPATNNPPIICGVDFSDDDSDYSDNN